MPNGRVERDGTASIRALAQKLCVLVNTFGPLIERQWGSNPEMQAALIWARAACTIVPQMDTAFASIPAGDPTPEDGQLWPGINPDRQPAAPAEDPIP